MVDSAHHGDDVRMQMVFSEIEVQSPIYQVCISKRTAGVLNRKWDIMPLDESVEAKKQAEEIKKVFEKSDTRNEDGLTSAMKHLVMSAFRGRSAVKPFFDDDGNLFFKNLNNWNVLAWNGNFFWNPSSEEVGWFDSGNPVNCIPLPKDEICFMTNSQPIDIPGLMLYLRQLVGEETWARLVEKQGIPQVVIEAPQGTPDTALDAWNYRAQQIYEGGSGTLPNGAKINFLDSARGQDPFTEYLRHQMEMISILATGGTLMTIGGPTGLGSDLARVQQEAFDQLVSQDCKALSNALTDNVVRKVAEKLGYKTPLCRFTFVEEEPFTVMEYIEMAEKCHNLGMSIDVEEFQKLTKLPFIAKQEQWIPKQEDKSGEWSVEDREALKKEIEEEEI